ncbi:sigma-70 family RNA polymerase sigma factor [Clostridium sp. OS1-26]|uniref:RNA polymerase sigma factor n=1 Tax=Clostridium sp. OS1-26 TaxID=3070681 RepID=UPI0027DFB370|nr:sigma-70 family RNA polymerase sigma factor [Clostridium sp. OS1-26]WML37408.1 sigma-70 family RNA polymerase sigma factor [Clostridium sp. OS1-26]
MVEVVSAVKDSGDRMQDIKLAKKGDKAAFVRIIEENKASMYRVAISILNNEQDVEDAFQNTIIKAYEGIGSLKKNQYFKTWLIRILINECNAILRSNKKIVHVEEFDDKASNDFSNLELTNAVNSLDEDLRVVTTLFYFEDIPQKDIANILSIPEGTVRSRLSRARNKLYEMLKER